jgi:hypothetical protein
MPSGDHHRFIPVKPLAMAMARRNAGSSRNPALLPSHQDRALELQLRLIPASTQPPDAPRPTPQAHTWPTTVLVESTTPGQGLLGESRSVHPRRDARARSHRALLHRSGRCDARSGRVVSVGLRQELRHRARRCWPGALCRSRWSPRDMETTLQVRRQRSAPALAPASYCPPQRTSGPLSNTTAGPGRD